MNQTNEDKVAAERAIRYMMFALGRNTKVHNALLACNFGRAIDGLREAISMYKRIADGLELHLIKKGGERKVAIYELKGDDGTVLDTRNMSWSLAEELNKALGASGKQWIRKSEQPPAPPPPDSFDTTSTPTPIVGSVSTAEQRGRQIIDDLEPHPEERAEVPPTPQAPTEPQPDADPTDALANLKRVIDEKAPEEEGDEDETPT